MRLLLIASTYPSAQNKGRGAFVYNLVQQLVDLGNEVTVIAPERKSILKLFSNSNIDLSFEDKATVYRPSFTSISSINFGIFNTRILTLKNFVKSARRALKNSGFKPDLIYGHFMIPAGFASVQIASELNIPSCIAIGESEICDVLKTFSKSFFSSLLNKSNAIISVSEVNSMFVKEVAGDAAKNKILLAPNGINQDLFKPLDKISSRKKLGLPGDDFIISFTGYFIDRKGPLRVLGAINKLPNVKGVFLGSGDQVPKGEKVLFCGKVKNTEVPIWLSASDVFVLPTRSEGSSNAIAEAMGCGLPIISSDIPEVRCQVTDENAILVNPNDVEAIAAAIEKLVNNQELVQAMKLKSFNIAKELSLSDRALKIQGYLVSTINNFNKK